MPFRIGYYTDGEHGILDGTHATTVFVCGRNAKKALVHNRGSPIWTT